MGQPRGEPVVELQDDVEPGQDALVGVEARVVGVGDGGGVDALVGVAEQRRRVPGPSGEPGHVVEPVLERGAVRHHPVVHLVRARVERGPGGPARRGLGVVGGEADAGGGQPVEVRRLHQRMARRPTGSRRAAGPGSRRGRSRVPLCQPGDRIRRGPPGAPPGAWRRRRCLDSARGARRRTHRGGRPVGRGRGLSPRDPPTGHDLRHPRGTRRHRRHMGPVPLPGRPLGLGHVHPRVLVRAVGRRQGHRRRPLDPRVHPQHGPQARGGVPGALPPTGGRRLVVDTGRPVDRRRRGHRHRRHGTS